MGNEAIEILREKKEFVKCLHSVGKYIKKNQI